MIKGLNHLTFSVSDLETSVKFYESVFGAKLLVKGGTVAYFDLNGIWLALNEEKDAPREGSNSTYTHIAFSVEEKDFDAMCQKLKDLNVNILPGRPEIRGINVPCTSPTRTATNLNSTPGPSRTGFNTIKKQNPT